jgi:hypothetical protein
MEVTKNASKVLLASLKMLGWDQGDLSDKSGIVRSTVSFHVTGSRPIRDDHLAAYCKALPSTEQALLVAAWLRDALPEDALASVFEAGETSSKLNEAVRTWAPTLDEELQEMLDYWTTQLATDTELAEIFRIATRRAGFRRRRRRG